MRRWRQVNLAFTIVSAGIRLLMIIIDYYHLPFVELFAAVPQYKVFEFQVQWRLLQTRLKACFTFVEDTLARADGMTVDR